MVVRSPPLQMGEQVWGLLRSGPGPSRERCHPVADGQWSPLDESGVESSRETQSLQGGFEICLCPQAHHRRDTRQFAPSVAFLHLTVDQPRCYLPLAHLPPSASYVEPLSKMGRESIKGEIETITGEERDAARCQGLSQEVHNQVCRMLCAGTQLDHRKKRACRGRWPATATARVGSCAVWCAVHPAGGAGARDGRRSARARTERASPHATARW